MTKEEKTLLLKDLCARLPYHVELWSPVADDNWAILTPVIVSNLFSADLSLPQVKPYLRSMSSMTEKEKQEYSKIVVKSQDCSYANNESATTMVNDWYLSKGFDVRGLIPKGLALEAPEGMYKNV